MKKSVLSMDPQWKKSTFNEMSMKKYTFTESSMDKFGFSVNSMKKYVVGKLFIA